MLAMPGMRTFSLAARGRGGISCDADGVFVGDVAPLVRKQSPYTAGTWSVRPLNEINHELTALYRLPIDTARKANALALIATALNRGDLALAAIATVQMQFPDPPPLAKGIEAREDIVRRAAELHWSGLLKFWDPAKHPRTGVPPNPGWFGPAGEGPEAATIVQVGDHRHYDGHPEEYIEEHPTLGGRRGSGGPLEIQAPLPLGLPFPRLGPRPPSTGVPARPPGPPPIPPGPSETEPKLPLPQQPPQLAPFVPKEKTSGIFRSGDFIQELQSGYDGPAALIPKGTPGFDGRVRSRAEGHAAAWMRLNGLIEGNLEINNPTICKRCLKNLPKALPSGSTLFIELPDGTIRPFKSREP
jgi:SCP1.201-like deaminase